MPHCVASQFIIYWLRADAYDTLGGTFISKKKEKIRQVPQIKFFMHAVRCFMLEFIEIVFSSCKPMKRRHSYAIMFCVLSPLSCAQTIACYPSLKTTTTRGLIVGFFDLKHMSVNHYPVLLSAADILLAVLDPAPPPPHTHPRGCDKLIFSRQFGPRSGPTKSLMFCSRNKGADKTACAVCRLIFACNKVGVHTSTDEW